jgi:hypothetical protein
MSLFSTPSPQPIFLPAQQSPTANNPLPNAPPPPPAFGGTPSAGPQGGGAGGPGPAFNASVLGSLPAPGQQAQRSLLGSG